MSPCSCTHATPPTATRSSPHSRRRFFAAAAHSPGQWVTAWHAHAFFLLFFSSSPGPPHSFLVGVFFFFLPFPTLHKCWLHGSSSGCVRGFHACICTLAGAESAFLKEQKRASHSPGGRPPIFFFYFFFLRSEQRGAAPAHSDVTQPLSAAGLQRKSRERGKERESCKNMTPPDRAALDLNLSCKESNMTNKVKEELKCGQYGWYIRGRKGGGI